MTASTEGLHDTAVGTLALAFCGLEILSGLIRVASACLLFECSVNYKDSLRIADSSTH